MRKLPKKLFLCSFLKKRSGFLLFEVVTGLIMFAFFAQAMLLLHQTITSLNQTITLNIDALDHARRLIEGGNERNTVVSKPSGLLVQQEAKSIMKTISCKNQEVTQFIKKDHQPFIQYQQVSVGNKNHTIHLMSCV